METTDDRLFTPAFIALTASELAYFLAGGLVIGITPFFVLGPVGADAAGLGVFARPAVAAVVDRAAARGGAGVRHSHCVIPGRAKREPGI